MTPEQVEALLGWTPLHRAAFRGDVDAVRALLDGGADVDAAAIDGWRPIFSAAMRGHAEVVRLLVGGGGSTALTNAGSSVMPLHLHDAASLSGDSATVRASGDRLNAPLFFLAAHARLGHRMTKVTDAGHSDGDMIGYESDWPERWAIDGPVLLDDDAMTLLGPHTRTEDGVFSVGPIVMERWTPENVRSWAQPTSHLLHARWLSDLYSAELAPWLLGDLTLDDARVRALFARTVDRRHVDVIDALVARLGRGVSDAVDRAIWLDDTNLLERVVGDPNDGHPLATAAFFGKPHAVSLLLAKGANPDLPKKNPPLLRALEKPRPEAIEVVIALLEHGADVNVADPKKGETPLHRAAMNGQADIVERLLRAGADPNVLTRKKLTPLRYAEVGISVFKGDHGATIELLRGWGARAWSSAGIFFVVSTW